MARRRLEIIEARTLEEAAALLAEHGTAACPLAGGGDLFPPVWDGAHGGGVRILVSLAGVPGLERIEYQDGQGLLLGAMARIADIQGHRAVRDRYRGIAQAAGEVGSPEVRRSSTLGGNLCQRPRCEAFRSRSSLCLRHGGAGCPALEGEHRYYHAVLEGGPCYAAHPSDLAPALIAAGATARIAGAGGSRWVPLEDFFVACGADPRRDTALAPGELLAEVRVPEPAAGSRSVYVKARVDPSWDFALASTAVTLVMRGEAVLDARVVLGGVAPRPLRAPEAEEILRAAPLHMGTLRVAAEAALAEARPLRLNGYKVELAKTVVRQAIERAVGAPIPPAEGPVLRRGQLVCCHDPAGPVRCRGCPSLQPPRTPGSPSTPR